MTPALPKLSILLVTYNHSQYIDRCLEGIGVQEFDGDCELVVADDASADDTVERVRAWSENQAKFQVRFLPAERNLGITKNYQRSFLACTGEYIAVVEGDDFWTSPFKLARQMKFLDQQRECDLCAVNYYVYRQASARFTPRIEPSESVLRLGARDLIVDNVVGNFSVCMYRRSALLRLPVALFDRESYDWIVNICVARWALIGFICEPMSVYRVHDGGTWGGGSEQVRLQKQLDQILAYDELTDGVFADSFAEISRLIRARLLQIKGKPLNAMLSMDIVRFVRWITPPVVLWLFRWVLPPVVPRLVRKILGKK